MRYEDRQYKISRDRLLELLKTEYDHYKYDLNNFEDYEEPFNLEEALAEFEELPSNDKKIVKLRYLQENCNRCVWYQVDCPGGLECPPGKKYKRDPPDGGYYG